jgi:UDP-N-acetylglucosamine acyltransferase
MIHPTAVIHPGAEVSPSAVVGPYAVIDEHVQLGADCVIGPHVHVTGHTIIGARNRFHASCVIGDAPQDLHYTNAPTGLRIGDDNIFREHVTVHRSNSVEEDTVLGSGNLLMVGSHVGHNTKMGDQVILTAGALIAGHAVLGDRAIVSGNCSVHQFTRLGTLSMMQGNSSISKDLPPFCVSYGINTMAGLNSIGLRRAGFSSEQRLELRRLYHQLFRNRRILLRQAVEEARQAFASEPARLLMDFVAATKRGICADSAESRKPRSTEED